MRIAWNAALAYDCRDRELGGTRKQLWRAFLIGRTRLEGRWRLR